jgi:hypothetical protein
MLKPTVSSQLMGQTGMGRPGGSSSRGSTRVKGDQGSGLAAMENMLLKLKRPNPKQLAPGSRGPQFSTQAGGLQKAGRTKAGLSPTPRAQGPAMLRTDAARTVPAVFRNRRTMY